MGDVTTYVRQTFGESGGTLSMNIKEEIVNMLYKKTDIENTSCRGLNSF